MKITKVRSTARTPDYSGTTSSDWSAPDLEDYGYDSVGDMSQEEKSDVAAHSLLGSADAGTFDELQFFPVVEPSSNNLNENALKAVISGRGSQANISASALNSAQSKARSLLESEFGMESEKEKIASRISKLYDISVKHAKDFLANIPELKKEMRHMEKDEIKETIKDIKSGEVELENVLDKLVDVDIDVIKEVKEEMDKENQETSEDKDISKLDKKVKEVMEEEDVSESKAMVKVLDKNPKLYETYQQRGG